MLAVFCGSDTIKVRKEALDFLNEKKESEHTLTEIDPASFVPGYLGNVAGAASLFGDREAYLIDTPSENKVLQSELMVSLDQLRQSASVFVVIESVLAAADKKAFEKSADHFQEYQKTAASRFNNFALADALIKKDKKLLWLLLSEARIEGVAAEEITSVLWWQLKTLRLAQATRTAAEAGMKDFPYNKSKKALAKFAPAELERLSRSLMAILHDSRLGGLELGMALERWVLKV